MPASQVSHQVRQHLHIHLSDRLTATSLERLTLLVVGILKAHHAAPTRIAQALPSLGLSEAQPESIQRRIRRIENDPELTAALCLHPLAQHRPCWSQPTDLPLILDATSHTDRVMMLTAAVWYPGQALPLAWLTWAANHR